VRRLLLDTHTFLWWLMDDSQLGMKAREAISEIRNTIYISAATSWEISIKNALGKLKIPDDIENIVEDEGFEKLPITFFHGQLAGSLPAFHRDPFDRMLIAQAQAEGLLLVTSDKDIFHYSVQLMDASR
jgi:PIN domain nuclease of toxin-antitoxin system